MNHRTKSLSLAAGTILALGLLLAPTTNAQPVMRFGANFQTSSELDTSLSPASGGTPFFTQTVKVPASINTLFVTISGAGDTEGNPSSALELNCQVDGTNCISAALSSNASPAGWVNLLVDGANNDSEDHSFSYTWCTPVSKSGGLFHDVKLSMASGNGLNFVFIERSLVTIDGAKLKSGCTGTF